MPWSLATTSFPIYTIHSNIDIKMDKWIQTDGCLKQAFLKVCLTLNDLYLQIRESSPREIEKQGA